MELALESGDKGQAGSKEGLKVTLLLPFMFLLIDFLEEVEIISVVKFLSIS